MDRLRVAIIGSGGMAHARAAHLAASERAAITCVSSRNAATGQSLADRYGAPYVLELAQALDHPEVDAVVVATLNDSHAQIARSALERGRHVLVEYPLAMRVEDADHLIALAGRRRVVLHVGHDQARVGWHLAVKDAAGGLGQLLALNGVLATATRGGARSVWRNRRLSGPPFMVGIAYVFHLLHIFGPPLWVEGTNSYEGLDDSGYYRSSASTMTMGLASGAVAQLLYIRGYSIPRDEQEQAMVFRSGFLSYRGYLASGRRNEGHLTQVTHAGTVALTIPPVTLAQAGRQNTEQFIREALDGSPVDPPVALARDAVATALAAERAAETCSRVTID